MSTDILTFFACAFNIIGLLMYMYDTKYLMEIYRGMSHKQKIAGFLAICVVSQIVVYTDIYLILILAGEGAAVLLWNIKQKREYFRVALKGVLSILLLLATELVIEVLFYYQGTELLTEAQMQVISYLGMATMQYLLIIFQESRNLEKGFKKMLIAALEVKAVENLVWITVCIRGAVFEWNYIALATWLVFTMVMCYVVFFIVLYKFEEREEMDRRADIHINAYEYYLHMEEEHLLIRKMYHEMKNQLMILENNKEEVHKANEKQIELFAEKMDALKQFYHTGFPSLDILLFDGKRKAEARGIEFEAVISEGCLSFMKEEDVNVIFSNAIINAIEACDKITDGPKSIKIKAGKNLDDTLVYVKNTVSRNRTKGSLQTGKKNKKLHGIGMTSIQECVEKYNGYVSVIEENDTFQLAILFGGGQK